MITFSKKDTIDSFEIFIENFNFKYETYNFYTLLKLFMFWLEKDILTGYEENEVELVKSTIRKTIYGYFNKLDFNIQYTKIEILNIIFKEV